MKKITLFMFFYCCVVQASQHEHQDGISSIMLLLERLEQLSFDANETIVNRNFAEDDRLALQSTVNHFYFRVQHAAFLMNKGVENITDSDVRDQSVVILEMGLKATYLIGKEANSDVPKIIKALREGLSKYKQMYGISRILFERALKVQQKLAFQLSFVKDTYDLALFNMQFMETALKYQRSSNQDIVNVTETEIKRLLSLLIRIKAESAHTNLSTCIGHMYRVLNMLMMDTERWLQLDVGDDGTLFLRSLRNILTSLKASMKVIGKNDVESSTIEAAYQNISTSLKGAIHLKKDISKNILLDVLALTLTTNSQLDIILKLQ